MLNKQIDVFLCHNSIEKHAVEEIREHLQSVGIKTWLDKYDLKPSLPWQVQIDELIPRVKIVAVCIGASGVGPSARIEIQKFLNEARIREIHIGLIVLKGCSDSSIGEIPDSIRRLCWMDLRQTENANVQRLTYEISRILSETALAQN